MFLKSGVNDISDDEFNLIISPHGDKVNQFIEEYIMPEVIAFYLANGYSRNCLSNCPLINHINSALDIFNVSCNGDELIPEIKLILRIKYNLKIIKINPLKFKKIM